MSKIKIREIESEHFLFWKCYTQGAPQKKQCHCFSHRAPKMSRINHFNTYILGHCWETKIKSLESGQFTFSKYYI